MPAKTCQKSSMIFGMVADPGLLLLHLQIGRKCSRFALLSHTKSEGHGGQIECVCCDVSVWLSVAVDCSCTTRDGGVSV